MTPQEDNKPRRTRREGNVVRIRTEFATRARFMVLWEARQQARQAVIRRIKAEGKAKVSLMSAGEIVAARDGASSRACGRASRSGGGQRDGAKLKTGARAQAR